MYSVVGISGQCYGQGAVDGLSFNWWASDPTNIY